MIEDDIDAFDLLAYGEEVNVRVCPDCGFALTDVTWALTGCSTLCPECQGTTLGEFELDTIQERIQFDG